MSSSIERLVDTSLGRMDLGIEQIIKEDNLIIYRRSSFPIQYMDIIGFAYLPKNNCDETWREIENKFVDILEAKILTNQYRVEPYFVFLADEESYVQSMQDVIQIERDEFNCRKYVLPLSKGIILEDSIFRLPLASLPLDKIRDILPPTAEKILRMHGSSQEFAQLLVKSDKFNNDDNPKLWKILNSGVQVLKPILSQTPSNLSNKKTDLPSVRLKNISIKGFRPYVGETSFDLDADLIIIAGPNGLGKTSFFDAIDFAVTGTVRRLEGNTELSNPLVNLSSNNCTVKLAFSVLSGSEKGEHTLSRSTGVYDELILNGKKQRDRRTILNTLTQTKSPEKVDRLVKLFRATHLINQYEAELTSSLWDSSTLKKETVGRMLSLEDYVQAEKRCQEIGKELSKREKELNKEKPTLDNKLKHVTLQLSEASSLDQDRTSHPTKLFDLKIILSEIDKLNIPLELKPELTPEFMHQLAAVISGRLSTYNERLLSLQSLRNEFHVLQQARTSILEKSAQYGLILKEHQQKLDNYKNDHEVYQSDQNKLQDIKQKLEKIQIKAGNLGWLQSIIPIKLRLEEQSIVIMNCLRQNYTNQDQLRQSIKSKQSTLGDITSVLAINKNNYNESRRILELNNRLKLEFPRINQTLTNISLLQGKVQNIDGTISAYKAEIEQLEKSLVSKKSTEKRYREEYNNFKLRLDNIGTLLQSVKEYIVGETCPLCGHNHNTTENLLTAIDLRIGDVPSGLEEALINITRAASSILEVQTQINSKMSNITEHEKFRTSLLTEYQAGISFLSEMSASLGINDFNAINEAWVDKKNEELNSYLLKIQTQIDSSSQQEAILFGEIKSLESSLTTEQSLIEKNKQELHKLELDLTSLRNQIIQKGQDPTIQLDAVQLEIKNSESEVNNLTNELKKLNQYILSKDASLSENRNEISLLKTKAEKLKVELDTLHKLMNKMENQCNVLSLAKDCTLDELDNNICECKETAKKVSSFQQSVLEAEMILDSSQREARINTLLLEKNNFLSEIGNISRQLASIKSIGAFLKSVLDTLNEYHNQALIQYCKATKPLSGMIQRRIRPIYGFGDLELDPNDLGEINVGITWNAKLSSELDNEKLAPYMYLSEAQMNAVGLSLFLSGTLTQTWSGLKTIMLDDPVQHFDDLNCYAFIDLIRSLLVYTPDSSKPQIIMSTCDDRLLRLMRQKFAPLQAMGKVKYYVFETLDEQGPVIKKMESSEIQGNLQ